MFFTALHHDRALVIGELGVSSLKHKPPPPGKNGKSKSKQLHHKTTPHVGGTQYAVSTLTPPSSSTSLGSYTSGKTFGTWNLAVGTTNFKSPGTISAYSGCDPSDGLTPISQICLRSGIYIDYLTILFSNGQSYAFGDSTTGSPPRVSY